jgi:hypothetical protein
MAPNKNEWQARVKMKDDNLKKISSQQLIKGLFPA